MIGKIDTVTKKYLSKNTIFADAFNFYVYDGEQVIKAEEWDAPCSLHEMFSIKNEKLLTFVPDYKINLISPSEISDLEFEKFKTGLGSAMQFIKHQKDKNLSWMKDYKRFEKVDFETVNLINVVTGSKIKVEKTEEEVNMCYAFENSMREAKELGIEIGKAEGENKFAKLINFLLKDKRNAEVMEVTENKEKRQELYKFYGISD